MFDFEDEFDETTTPDFCDCEDCKKFWELPLSAKKKAYQEYLASVEYYVHQMWLSFDVDEFMPERELIDEDYTEDLILEENEDWMLWELEMINK